MLARSDLWLWIDEERIKNGCLRSPSGDRNSTLVGLVYRTTVRWESLLSRNYGQGRPTQKGIDCIPSFVESLLKILEYFSIRLSDFRHFRSCWTFESTGYSQYCVELRSTLAQFSFTEGFNCGCPMNCPCYYPNTMYGWNIVGTKGYRAFLFQFGEGLDPCHRSCFPWIGSGSLSVTN